MKSIRLYVVEDQPQILKHLVKLLDSFEDISIIGAAISGEEAVSEILVLEDKPDVVLCDLGLPKMNGIQVTEAIVRMSPRTEILIFTVFEDEDKVLEAIKAGAAGYLLKGVEIQKIYDAIIDVANGGSVIQPALARRLLKYFSLPVNGSSEEILQDIDEKKQNGKKVQLTMRELECLQIVAKGLSNNEAASVLKLSKATIRTHLEHIYEKLEVSNRVEAITEGLRQGIIDL